MYFLNYHRIQVNCVYQEKGAMKFNIKKYEYEYLTES